MRIITVGLATAIVSTGLALVASRAAPPPVPNGQQIFAQNCAACHQITGKGIPGAFPALAGDKFVTGDPRPVALTVLNGRGGMPAFRDGLNDGELAAVVSYVRRSWGNKAAPVPPALFTAVRKGGKAALARPIPAH